jgi:hypothetical protein
MSSFVESLYVPYGKRWSGHFVGGQGTLSVQVNDDMRAHALDRRGGEAQTIAPASAYAWTAMEMVNDVYLLAGAADGSIALFDLVRCVPRPPVAPSVHGLSFPSPSLTRTLFSVVAPSDERGLKRGKGEWSQERQCTLLPLKSQCTLLPFKRHEGGE